MQLNLYGDYENALTYVSAPEYLKLSQIALEVSKRLSTIYSAPNYDQGRLDILDQLIYALLSQRTRSPQADQAFTSLLYFNDWRKVLDAPIDRIEQMIATSTYFEQKARWLKDVLLKILMWNDGKNLSLSFLKDLSAVDAASVLRTLVGIGFKTSNATLLMCCWQLALLPVDTNGRRVLARMGLIPSEITDSARVHAIARALLPAHWGARDLELAYFVLKRLGQNYCTFSSPNCRSCPLLDLCQYGRLTGMSASRGI